MLNPLQRPFLPCIPTCHCCHVCMIAGLFQHLSNCSLVIENLSGLLYFPVSPFLMRIFIARCRPAGQVRSTSCTGRTKNVQNYKTRMYSFCANRSMSRNLTAITPNIEYPMSSAIISTILGLSSVSLLVRIVSSAIRHSRQHRQGRYVPHKK